MKDLVPVVCKIMGDYYPNFIQEKILLNKLSKKKKKNFMKRYVKD